MTDGPDATRPLAGVRIVEISSFVAVPLAGHGDELAEMAGGLPRRLLDELGAVPSYYLRYFYAHDEVLAEQLGGATPRAATVAEIERELLAMYADPALDRKPALLEQRGGAYYSEAAVALLASGLSSSSVGTYAGQVVMQGFINRRIPLFLRRALTMLPALIVLELGLPTTASLAISQVVLSFGIPFALVPMILLTRNADVMGELVNRRLTTVVASVVAAMIIALNVFLLYETFFG